MKYQKVLLFPLALLLAMVLGLSSAQADLITNGSFEEGYQPPTGKYKYLFSNPPTNDDITGWLVTSGEVDWINSFWKAHTGTRSLDLNGTEAGAIETTFATITGQTYTVSFWLSGNFNGASDPTPSEKGVRVSSSGSAPAG